MKISDRTFESLEAGSIKEMLASCAVTETGKEALLGINAFSSPDEISTELNLVAEIVSSGTKKDRFHVGFSEDISEAVSKAGIGSYVLEPSDFLDISSAIYSSRSIFLFCRKHRDDYPGLWNEFSDIPDLQDLYEMINRIIGEDGEVSDDASPELRKIRSKIRTARNRISKKLDSIVKESSKSEVLTESIVTLRNGRYVIPVRSEKKALLPGIVHERSSSGASLYVEPSQIVEMNNEVVTLTDDERKEIRKILHGLTVECSKNISELELCRDRILKADILNAKAVLAEEMDAVKPAILKGGYYLIEGARHPLLDPKLKFRREVSGIGTEGPEKVVPIDVDLSDGARCLIITGPNTGGKTAAMKTVGLFTLMAHMGLFLPADKAVIPFLKAVYADIGDIQSLVNDLSTFSGHMRNISEIINDFKEPSLVLLDEIGSGTDPDEGTALALSIVEYFLEKNTVLLISTHKSKLKILAYEHPKVDNATVDFDRDTLKPTYKLIRGMPGRSNALHVAEVEGLPKSILDKSLEYLKGNSLDMDKAIVGMEEERSRMERARSGFEDEKAVLAKREAELKEQKDKIEDERKSMLKDCYMEVRNSLDELKQMSKDALADFENRREIEKSLNRIKEKHIELMSGLNEEIREISGEEDIQIKIGSNVTMEGIELQAKVVRIDGNIAEIEAGNAMMKLPVNRLRLVPPSGKKSSDGNISYGFDKKEPATELDLRGNILDEALIRLDKFMDDAIITGLKKFRIIHGKGTGALRKGISNKLRFDKRVGKSSSGEPREGGSGVTIVELN